MQLSQKEVVQQMSSQNPQDPLDQLFEDKRALDTALLAEIIKPYIRLTAEPPEVFMTERWHKLNVQQKLLTFMLGRKALRVKGYIDDAAERVQPSQIAEATGLNPNSIRPTLTRSRDERLVRTDKKEGGAYWIPDYALVAIKNLMSNVPEDK